MIYSLGEKKQAPAMVKRTTRSGVPVVAVLASTSAAFAGCAANYLAPRYVFETLLSTTGTMALLVYLVIAVSQLRMRRDLIASNRLRVRMWLHPFLGLFVVALIVLAFVVMVCGQAHRSEVVSTLGLSAMLAMTGMVVERRRRKRPS